MSTLSEVGLVGLAVMGQNLSLNIASHGFALSVWNRTPEKTTQTIHRADKEITAHKLKGFFDLQEFVQSITKPRKIILLIQAGPPVDAALDSLLPLLAKGDLVVDGGNEWFENTNRRAKRCEQMAINYMGMGVSGGEDGARYGPALMPGGSERGYQAIQHILAKIAAKVEDGPCVSYIGPEGSGNYVKMVHNGIEYADMQLIAEAYAVLKQIGKFSNEQLHITFSEWNDSELKSYLIEITASIFQKKDDMPSSQGYLVDKIADKAGAKGTGKWTIQEASNRGVPCPSIEAAVSMRNLSQLHAQRSHASTVFIHAHTDVVIEQIKDVVREALYCAKICAYAQGFMLLKVMSDEQKWNLNLSEIGRTWKGGCIIRAGFLDRIREAYRKDATLASLLVDQYFTDMLKSRITSLRKLVEATAKAGIAVPAMSASLAYFDAYRCSQLPLNLVQAQRDYFGAHTYQRIDREGVFHTEWTN